MQNLIRLKNNIYKHEKILKAVTFIICLPFILIILNYLLNTILNLGIYTGTFFRFLYDIVVY